MRINCAITQLVIEGVINESDWEVEGSTYTIRINCKTVQIINRNSVATILCDNDKDNSKQIEPSDNHKKDIERIYEGIIDI